MRHVGDAGQEFLEFGIDGVLLLIERGDLRLESADLFLEGGGVRAGFLQLADLGALFVSFGF